MKRSSPDSSSHGVPKELRDAKRALPTDWFATTMDVQFHPVVLESRDTEDTPVNLEELTCSLQGTDCSSVSYEDDFDVMSFDPYPITSTNKEMLDCKDLNNSFGENWSEQLADDLSNCDKGTSEVSDDERSFSGDDDNDNNSSSEEQPKPEPIPEPPEIRAKRNMLWKQSLKASLFSRSTA